MKTKTKALYFNNRNLWIDTFILILMIFVTSLVLIEFKLFKKINDFILRNENLFLYELITILAISSIYMLLFMLKRFIELQKIIEDANTDPLIGITNRRKGSEYIANEIVCLRNINYQSSLIMYDIDNFKQINDEYGHEVGDLVLRQITSTVEKVIRNSDINVRWGGEEFIVICPNTNLSDALILAERFRKSIEKSIFITDIKITASFGVVEIKKAEDFKELINRVDKLLYKSKKEGKNRISF